MGIVENLISTVAEAYDSVINLFPASIGMAIQVFVIAVLISVVALFVWYFYRTLSQMNLISLNLSQYNRSEHPATSKFLATLFYLLENIIIMPVLISLWFAALSIFLLVIASERTVVQILMLSAALVMAIRILAYSNGEISKDVAKLFPFITLSVFLLTPGAFDLANVFGKLSEVPLLLGDIFSFIFAIFLVEIALRIVYTIMQFTGSRMSVKGGGEGVAVVKKGRKNGKRKFY